MAAGKINLQANDGKVAGVVFEDGASSNVTVTVPKEGGVVATKAYADTKVSKTGDETIAGVKTFSNNLNFASGTRITGDFSNATDSSRLAFETNVQNSFTVVSAFPNGTGVLSSFRAFSTAQGLNSSFAEVYCDQTRAMVSSGTSGTGAYLPLTFYTGGSERMRIDSSGNVLVTGSGGLGYGTGSGGIVTQLTSKSTAVTLNKPSGRIIMNGAALAAGATVTFVLNNSLIGESDIVTVECYNNGYTKAEVFTTIVGAAYIHVTNISASSQSLATDINFTVIKGAKA